MQQPIKEVPFTYLRSLGNQKDYDLYIYIPIRKYCKVEFEAPIPAINQNSRSRIQNRIHFINCKLIKSGNNTGGNYKCFRITRKTPMEDESIEIRVRVGESEDGYIRFNKTVIFFADADDSKQNIHPQNPNSNRAINVPYTFIGSPKDFFSAKRTEDSTFGLHLLIPLDNGDLYRETLKAKEGKNTWRIVNNSGKFEIGKVMADRVISEENPLDGLKVRRLTVNVHRLCIDKPTTPDRGSGNP